MSSGSEAVVILAAVFLVAVLARKAWSVVRERQRYGEHMAWATELQQFLISKNKELASILNDTHGDVETRRKQADAVIAQMESRESRDDPGVKALIADTRAYVLEVLGPPHSK